MKPLMELRANSGNCICIATDGAIGEHFGKNIFFYFN